MRAARRRVLAAFVVGAAVLSGCGRLVPFASDPTPSDIRELPDDANAADVAFLRDMIDHLEAGQSLTAAALDPDTDAGDDVDRLARHVEDEDDGRIVQMVELLEAWGQASITSTNPDAEPAVIRNDDAQFTLTRARWTGGVASSPPSDDPDDPDDTCPMLRA